MFDKSCLIMIQMNEINMQIDKILGDVGFLVEYKKLKYLILFIKLKVIC